MSQSKVKSVSSGDAVLSALRDSICSGRWLPGTPLVQSALADEFGVSRIPVREALQTLQAEGLVKIEPNRGTFVTEFTKDQLDEIFDLRTMLEIDVLKRAIPRHTPQSLRQLESIQRELDHAQEKEDWLRLDREFHDALYAPSDRTRTLSTVSNLRASVDRFYGSHLGPQTRRDGWRDEHQNLLDAVRQGSTDAACALLELHIRNTQAVAIDCLDTIQAAKE